MGMTLKIWYARVVYWVKGWRTSLMVAKAYRCMNNDQRNRLTEVIADMFDVR